MIFWVFVTMFIIGIILCCIHHYKAYYSNFLDVASCVTTVLGGVVALIMGLCIIFIHLGLEGQIAQLEVRRETLVYQLETNMYENDNDIGKRELMKDIQEYNETIARNRANQNDFWYGIFIPNIYDQFELIDLEVTND